jgi:hypothetical protein
MNTRTSCLALSMVLGSGLLFGCQSAPWPHTAGPPAASQAAAVERTRCTSNNLGDAAVASVLDGSAVERVDPLYDGGAGSPKTELSRLQGAAIRVRPAPGETAEWLNRALECHGAQQLTAHKSGAVAQTNSDPFWLPDSLVQVEVTSAGDTFLVQVTSGSTAEAREILSRAKTLSSTHGAWMFD